MTDKNTFIAPPPMIMPGGDKPVGEGEGFGLGAASSPYCPAGYTASEEEEEKEEDEREK